MFLGNKLHLIRKHWISWNAEWFDYRIKEKKNVNKCSCKRIKEKRTLLNVLVDKLKKKNVNKRSCKQIKGKKNVNKRSCKCIKEKRTLINVLVDNLKKKNVNKRFCKCIKEN